ncbi:MAG: hypothetical protein HY335_10135 [Deinococcus sp.]|nr:hypothetical protein [Deinococcus sp.]
MSAVDPDRLSELYDRRQTAESSPEEREALQAYRLISLWYQRLKTTARVPVEPFLREMRERRQRARWGWWPKLAIGATVLVVGLWLGVTALQQQYMAAQTSRLTEATLVYTAYTGNEAALGALLSGR